MDQFYQFIAEPMAPETYDVDTSVPDRFLSRNDIGWDILAKATSSLDHHIAPHVTELVAENSSTDNRVVINGYLSCKFGGVPDDHVASKEAVVRDVHVFHQQIVASHLGCPLGSRAPADCDILADAIVIPDLTDGIFPFEF